MAGCSIDGIDVRQLDLDQLRRNVGLVFQESFLFSNTVAANIAFGHPEATPRTDRTGGKNRRCHEFIVQLPEGYDTVIGEYGSNLSGGQRQRLAIARAILLEPPILILDDAMAAVDPETEHEIMVAMEASDARPHHLRRGPSTQHAAPGRLDSGSRRRPHRPIRHA